MLGSNAESECEKLIHTPSPVVVFATNTFIDTPIILQFEDTPLIEVVRTLQAGFTTQFQIYASDGTHLAKVVGSRLFTTEVGTKAGLRLRHPDRMTVCELGGRTVFEVRRTEAAALATQAELYTPQGAFIRGTDTELGGHVIRNDQPLTLSSMTMEGCRFERCRIGIWVKSDGSVRIGCG